MYEFRVVRSLISEYLTGDVTLANLTFDPTLQSFDKVREYMITH